MKYFITINAILACAYAAPGLYYADHVITPGKSTLTSSSQVVDHGSTYHLSVPVVQPLHTVISPRSTLTSSSQVVNHGSVLHAPVYANLHVPLSKMTLTHSSQVVNHGGETLVHAPVVSHVPVQSVLVHSSPLVTYKTGDAAISHQSSTVHETVLHH